MQRRPTMRDVAAAAGVSVKTVSRVVNDEAAVRDVVADRVRAAIDALGYRPDHRAQLLRRRGNGSATIGFVPFDVSNPFFSAIYRGLEDVAWANGYAVVAGSSDGTRERGDTILKRLIGGRVDGLVVVPAGDDHTLIAEEVGRGTPVVLLDLEVDDLTECRPRPLRPPRRSPPRRRAPHRPRPSRHRLPRRRGVDLLGPRALPRLRRGDARRTDQAAAGLDAARPRHDDRRGKPCARCSPTAPRPRPSALFSAQNAVTIGAVQALHELGLHRVVALVGFDDVDMADVVEPGLTRRARSDRWSSGGSPASCSSTGSAAIAARRGEPILANDLIARGSGEIAAPPLPVATVTVRRDGLRSSHGRPLTPAAVNEMVAHGVPGEPGAVRRARRPPRRRRGRHRTTTTSARAGFVAGPTQFALADAALWYLVFGALGRIEPMALTSELSIRFLRPAIGPTLHARADLAAISRRSVVGSVTLWTGDAEQADRRCPGHLRPAAGDVTITDPDDERLADFVDLADPAARRRRERDELFIAEGLIAVATTDRVAAPDPFDPRHAQAPPAGRGAARRRRHVPILVADEDVVARTVGFDFHRGVVASAATAAAAERRRRRRRCPTDRRAGRAQRPREPRADRPFGTGLRRRGADPRPDVHRPVLPPDGAGEHGRGAAARRRPLRRLAGGHRGAPRRRVRDLGDDAGRRRHEHLGARTSPERLAIVLGAEGPGLQRGDASGVRHGGSASRSARDVDSLNVGHAAAIAFAVTPGEA